MEKIYDEAVRSFEEEHIKAVRKLGAECTVLLKKDGAFPLEAPGKIAALGEGVCSTTTCGTGSGEVNVRHPVTVEEGLQKAGFTLTEEAEDTAIYVLVRNSGEGSDRKPVPGDIELTETEVLEILAASRRYRRFMLVLNVCGMVDLRPVEEVQNILLLGQLGIPAGDVLADLLLGKSYPSGKLAMTWAPLDSYPSTEGFGDMDDTVYREGIYVGYRYFQTMGASFTYPFGFGLGYTDFRVEALAVTDDEKVVTAEVRVTNTGSFPGKEVVQLYVSAPKGRLDKPARELRGFAKTGEVAPGESEVLKIWFNKAEMASYQEDSSSWILEPGDYRILIGTDCVNAESVAVIRQEGDVVRKLKPIFPVKRDCEEETSDCDPEEIPMETKVLWEEVIRGDKTLEQFIGSLSDDQLICLCTGFHEEGTEAGVIGIMAKSLAGAAGETTDRLEELGVPAITMADGPAGLRLSASYKDEDSRICYQYCTAIPVATALAQSWNPEICRICGDLVGDEMERVGADLWLAPAQNIQRSPLCGRNFEYLSEHPFLSGICAGHLILGVQSHPGRGATAKHFVCNNQERNRIRSNSVVSERALREIYLRTFQISIEICEPLAVMTSYNLVNGEHTCTSRALVTGVLRNEWGFGGLVMTDWCVTTGAPEDSSRVNRYSTASAAGCIRAGGDIVMPGAWQDEKDMREALENGEHDYPLRRTHLQQAAGRVLRTVLHAASRQDESEGGNR